MKKKKRGNSSSYRFVKITRSGGIKKRSKKLETRLFFGDNTILNAILFCYAKEQQDARPSIFLPSVLLNYFASWFFFLFFLFLYIIYKEKKIVICLYFLSFFYSFHHILWYLVVTYYKHPLISF